MKPLGPSFHLSHTIPPCGSQKSWVAPFPDLPKVELIQPLIECTMMAFAVQNTDLRSIDSPGQGVDARPRIPVEQSFRIIRVDFHLSASFRFYVKTEHQRLH
jgi:hypothetical protein